MGLFTLAIFVANPFVDEFKMRTSLDFITFMLHLRVARNMYVIFVIFFGPSYCLEISAVFLIIT